MIEKLRKIRMFASLPDEVMEELAGVVRSREAAEGERVFGEGEPGDCMYIVAAGEVEISKEERTLGILGEGDIFGEMALYEAAARSATAIARSACTLYAVGHADFERLILSHPSCGVVFLYDSVRQMSRRLRHTTDYLTTVFETGRIVGGNHTVTAMAGLILERLMRDIAGATGGMIALVNPFGGGLDTAAIARLSTIDQSAAEELMSANQGREFRRSSDLGCLQAVPLTDGDRALGHILVEKAGPGTGFTTEEEIILSAVGNQVGLGMLNAYSRREDEARRRLEYTRMMDRSRASP